VLFQAAVPSARVLAEAKHVVSAVERCDANFNSDLLALNPGCLNGTDLAAIRTVGVPLAVRLRVCGKSVPLNGLCTRQGVADVRMPFDGSGHGGGESNNCGGLHDAGGA
jgi:hypothetical protein